MGIITVVGVNHRTAPVEIREKLSFTESQTREALSFLGQRVGEGVILCTCNRTEIYTVSKDEVEGKEAVLELFSRNKGLSPEQAASLLCCRFQRAAVRHLFRVSAGLDSMILGETQILGQVKEAYERACAAGTAKQISHALFQRAFRAGKRVHTETGINDKPASVSYAAVELARGIFGGLRDRAVLVVGAGEMSELTLRHLYEYGARRILVANRTRERARLMADKFEGEVLEFRELDRELDRADIVISSTGAPHYIFYPRRVEEAMQRRGNRKLFFIDIAVPRDVDPAVGQAEGVYLYDIDDLQEVVDANFEERRAAAQQGEHIIEEEVGEFMEWYNVRQVAPLITALRRTGEDICRAELNRTLSRLPHLGAKERKAVEAMARSIVNRILREPVLSIKEAAAQGEVEELADALCRLFNLEEDVPVLELLAEMAGTGGRGSRGQS